MLHKVGRITSLFWVGSKLFLASSYDRLIDRPLAEGGRGGDTFLFSIMAFSGTVGGTWSCGVAVYTSSVTSEANAKTGNLGDQT